MKAHRFRRRLIASTLGAASLLVVAGALGVTGSTGTTFAKGRVADDAGISGSLSPASDPSLARFAAPISSASAASANPPILAPADVIVGEADGTVNLVVRLAEEGTQVVTVHYTTANITAGGGLSCNADYVPASGTLTFPVGVTTQTVPVQILNCADVEGFEQFALNLSSATNGVIARASSRVGIVDNDTVVATPKLFVRDTVVDEKDGNALVSVLLGGTAGQASNSTVTVNFATAAGTATGGDVDYSTTTGALSFAPGETAKTIPVPIIDDGSDEGVESFTLNLSGAVNATIADGTGVITIGASDAPATSQPNIRAPADSIIGESDGYADLVVGLSAPGTDTVSLNYSTANVTAGGGFSCNADYTPESGTLTFAPGETTKVVRVQILDCLDAEGFEEFALNLSSATNAVIARASSRVGIVDNENVVATPRLFVRDAVVDEQDGFALVSVLLGGTAGQASNSTVSVNFATAGGTATGGGDYTSVSGTLSFAPGETAKTVVIPISDDATSEPAETFALNLSSPTGATISDGTGVITIGASDAASSSQPSIFAPIDAIVGEGDGFVDLAVRLSQPGDDTVSVNYSTANITAGGGFSCNADYTPESGTINFAPGETMKVVRVQILDCADVEGFEAFNLNLSTAVNGAITRASSRISIVDNDTVVATPRLFVRDAVVDEQDGFALVSVLMGNTGSQSSNSTVTVGYATAGGTATADSDYTSVSGTLTFAPGETAKTVPVPIADDGTPERVESFTLNLSGPVNATISDGTGVITIGASDASASSQPSILAPPDAIVGESDGYIDLVVSLSAPGTDPVSVNYSTANVTAGGGFSCNADYTPVSGTVNFAPGETTKVVRVQILDCADVEGFEGFYLDLSTAVNGAITRASSRISIVDNDTVVATPKLTVRDAVVDEKDGFALVSVLMGNTGSQSSNSTVTVDYASADGSAGAGSDYTAVSGTLTFAPHETAKTVVIPIADDGVNEPAESFSVVLSNPVGATLADGTGTVVIGASDGGVSALPGIFAPADITVNEGDGFVDLVVSLGAPSADTVSVNYTTQNVTAGGGFSCNADYTPEVGKLTFLPGETTKVVRVQILDCADVEGSETFNFNLSTAVNGSISDASAVITIADNDGATVTLTSIAVTPVNPTIATGGDQQFSATGTFSDSHVEDLTSSATWASTSTSVTTVSASGLAHGAGVGTSTISATSGSVSGSTLLTVAGGGAAQTISFAVLPDKTFGDPDFTVSATASSGLPVSFAASGSCTLAGSTVHLTGAGSCTITASQAGNGSFSPAPDLPRSFTINKASQTITFATLADKTFGDPDFGVSATASSGLAVSFAATAGNCTVTGSSVHLTGAGSCTITSSQAGNANYNAASAVGRTFTINKASQTITFAALLDKALGDPDFTVAATASSGLAVSFAGSGNCTASGSTIHLTGAGSCTITASQAGNANYDAASSLARTFAIKSGQTISFGALASKTFGDPDFAVSATASSGLAVSFAASGNCTISGATVHLTGAGTCTITASQPGNGTYLAAPSIARTFVIGKANQTISFGVLANKKLGNPDFTVSASASSGLAVGFAAAGKCTISGARVHLVAAGSCTITASQAGNANFNPATAVSRSFTIAPKPASCKVPKLVGKTLAAAKALIKRSHCQTGKVTRVYSRQRKAGIVIGQSLRAGRTVKVNTKINLVVSRGRRR